MIKINKKQIIVEFGFGDVSMTSGTSKTGDGRVQGVLAIRDCPMGICGTVVPSNENSTNDEFPVMLSFNNINSIDVLISSLERTKKLLMDGDY